MKEGRLSPKGCIKRCEGVSGDLGKRLKSKLDSQNL
jgi:hypothetical protein